MIIYMVGSILLSLLFSLCKIFDVDTNMRNYFISILIALIACIIFDYFKFSRYMSNRRK